MTVQYASPHAVGDRVYVGDDTEVQGVVTGVMFEGHAHHEVRVQWWDSRRTLEEKWIKSFFVRPVDAKTAS